MTGVMLTQRVKQSLASDTLPSRSNCRPRCRLVSLRLSGTVHKGNRISSEKTFKQ